jgi:hypothetical protein
MTRASRQTAHTASASGTSGAGAPETKIEVTPTIVRAGGYVLLRDEEDRTWKQIVERIYRAMEEVRRQDVAL